MIHKIVEEALTCIEAYKVDRVIEKYEMIYCTARIEANEGKKEAMTVLNQHLDKHYTLQVKTPPMCASWGKDIYEIARLQIESQN